MKRTTLIISICFLISLLKGQNNYYFPPTATEDWETTSTEELNWSTDAEIALDSFAENSRTNALIILHKGRIAKESYYNDFEQGKNWYWASAGKSLNAFLMGMALQDGLVDLESSSSDYLGKGWTSCTEENEGLIKVKHQLSMTTGLDYTADIDCTTPDCLSCLNDPGSEWYYHNAPYTLVSSILENQYNTSITQVTNQKLRARTGIFGAWIDIESVRTFFSSPRTMARFGLLMLNRGIWEQDTILQDENYFDLMISPSQDINPAYGYLWWLNGQSEFRLPQSLITFFGELLPNAPGDAYMALGKNGQIIIVVPSEDLVVVRMGDNPDGDLVPIFYLRDLWDSIAGLKNSTSNTNIEINSKLKVYPNPSTGFINIDLAEEVVKTQVINMAGQVVFQGSNKQLDVSILIKGTYILKVITDTASYSTVINTF